MVQGRENSFSVHECLSSIHQQMQTLVFTATIDTNESHYNSSSSKRETGKGKGTDKRERERGDTHLPLSSFCLFFDRQTNSTLKLMTSAAAAVVATKMRLKSAHRKMKKI